MNKARPITPPRRAVPKPIKKESAPIGSKPSTPQAYGGSGSSPVDTAMKEAMPCPKDCDCDSVSPKDKAHTHGDDLNDVPRCFVFDKATGKHVIYWARAGDIRERI